MTLSKNLLCGRVVEAGGLRFQGQPVLKNPIRKKTWAVCCPAGRMKGLHAYTQSSHASYLTNQPSQQHYMLIIFILLS